MYSNFLVGPTRLILSACGGHHLHRAPQYYTHQLWPSPMGALSNDFDNAEGGNDVILACRVACCIRRLEKTKPPYHQMQHSDEEIDCEGTLQEQGRNPISPGSPLSSLFIDSTGCLVQSSHSHLSDLQDGLNGLINYKNLLPTCALPRQVSRLFCLPSCMSRGSFSRTPHLILLPS